MKPDVIVAWPRHCEFPLWRHSIAAHRPHVARVLVAFTNHHADLDYRDFVAARLAGIAECFDAPDGDGDWRDRAVNAALDRSTAETVWFTEQDLLVADPAGFWGFWRTARWGKDPPITAHPCGWREDGSMRWHPSCLIVPRLLVDAAGRYFGPDPVDHFYEFGCRLTRLAGVTDLRLLFRFGGFLDRDICDVTHMAGLSSNHRLADAERYGEVFDPPAFYAYLRACLDTGDLAPGWAKRAHGFLDWAERPHAIITWTDP